MPFTVGDLEQLERRELLKRIRGKPEAENLDDRDDFAERLAASNGRPDGYRPPRGDNTRPVIEALRDYQLVEDEGHVKVTLAGALTALFDGDPLWLMLIGGPSSGKTEALRALGGLARSIDDVTVAGLLGWVGSGSKGRPSGLLLRVGSRGLATIADLSTLLAGDFKEREKTFAALRRIYDGSYSRALGTYPQPLKWKGRLTLIAAVTGVVDNYSSHADALGPRWVYFRIPDLSAAGKKRAAAYARITAQDKREQRAHVQELATIAVGDAAVRLDMVAVPDELADTIIDTAIVATQARAGVPRSGYGQRDVIGEVVREEPMRLSGQLELLARGLLALRVSRAETIRLVRRCALDSIDRTRRRALADLADGEVLTANQLAQRIGCDWHVAARALEDLALTGLIEETRLAADGRPLGGPRPYRLADGDYTQLVQEAFK